MTENREVEIYVLKEIQKLRDMHEAALQYRLRLNSKMRDIITRWKSFRLSQFFAKWKLLRGKVTDYQRAKLKWIAHIRKRRITQAKGLFLGKSRVERDKFIIANSMRNRAKISILEKREKDERERRAKSAKVDVIRNILKSRQDTSRQLDKERKARSVFPKRAGSLF